MKVKIEVEMPDGKFCEDCNYVQSRYNESWCILFQNNSEELLKQSKNKIKKCKECLEITKESKRG